MNRKPLVLVDQTFVYVYFTRGISANEQDKHAQRYYGAVPAVLGINGRGYCIGKMDEFIPACDTDWADLLAPQVQRLFGYARAQKAQYFYVAELASGLLSDQLILALFANAPRNVIFPASIYKVLNPDVSRICVAGSRFFLDYTFLEHHLDAYLAAQNKVPLVVSGGAPGADSLAERYCKKRGIKNLIIQANWRPLRRRAGPLRNESMMWLCHELVAFKDSREHSGTAGMIQLCQSNKKNVKIIAV